MTGSWSVLTTECRDPADTGARSRRVLSWQDVLSAVRRIEVPALEVSAPRYTLVNLDTTFYTRPTTVDRTLSIIGYTVDVQLQPARYTWHWGDGTASTTTEPGQPYPSTQVSHTYVHASDKDHPLALSVDTTYTLRYRVDSANWIDVAESLTIPGTPTTLPIKQASAVLVPTPEGH